MLYRWLVFLFLLSAYQAKADGMSLDDKGRDSGGKFTELTLTPWQIAQLRCGGTSVLQLNSGQISKLRAESGRGPSRLSIYNTRAGENDCTCCLANVGLWVSEWSIQIPHQFLDEAEVMPKSNGNKIAAAAACVVFGLLLCCIPFTVWKYRRRKMQVTLAT